MNQTGTDSCTEEWYEPPKVIQLLEAYFFECLDKAFRQGSLKVT